MLVVTEMNKKTLLLNTLWDVEEEQWANPAEGNHHFMPPNKGKSIEPYH